METKIITEEQPIEVVRGLILNVLVNTVKDCRFVSQRTFYEGVCELGYTGDQKRLNDIAQEMEEVDGVERGKSGSIHYRLRRDN